MDEEQKQRLAFLARESGRFSDGLSNPSDDFTANEALKANTRLLMLLVTVLGSLDGMQLQVAGSVAQLGQTVMTLQRAVSSLDARVAALETNRRAVDATLLNLNGAVGSIAPLSSAVSALQSALTRAQNDIRALQAAAGRVA